LNNKIYGKQRGVDLAFMIPESVCYFSWRVSLERKSKDTRVVNASRLYGKRWNTYGDGTSDARWAEDLRCWIIVQRTTDCALTAREAESLNIRLSQSIITVLSHLWSCCEGHWTKWEASRRFLQRWQSSCALSVRPFMLLSGEP
jgi:hypothetical protein